MRSLLEEIGHKLKAIPLNGDNQGAIFMVSNPVQERCIKHIDICYHYICEVVRHSKIILQFIDGSKNPADLFTKNLGHVKFLEIRGQLRLEFYLPESASAH